MKVYITSSKRYPEEYLKTIESVLKKVNHTILHRKRPLSYDNVSQEEAEQVAFENMALIRSCDLLIAEISFVSGAVGYHISQAIAENKFIIILYNLNDFRGEDRAASKIPVTFKGLNNKRIIACRYHKDNLVENLENCLKQQKIFSYAKFNFLISPEINEYLEWSTKRYYRSKSELVRDSLSTTMNNDTDYQLFKKGGKM